MHASTQNDMASLIPLQVAAARLGVHVSTLRAWVRTGQVPAYRTGQRFTRVDWEELLSALAFSRKPASRPEIVRQAEADDAP